jgi:hypothetical protein
MLDPSDRSLRENLARRLAVTTMSAIVELEVDGAEAQRLLDMASAGLDMAWRCFRGPYIGPPRVIDVAFIYVEDASRKSLVTPESMRTLRAILKELLERPELQEESVPRARNRG